MLKRKNVFLLIPPSCSLHISPTHRDNRHFQNTENVIHTKKIRAWKASNLLGGPLKTVQVFRESVPSYITIHSQVKTIKFYGQQDTFPYFLCCCLTLNITLLFLFLYWALIHTLKYQYSQIFMSELPKKEESRNFLPFIWFSLLQPSTFPYIKNIWKRPKHCVYLYLHNGKGPLFPCWKGYMTLSLTSTLSKVTGTIILGQATSVLLPNFGEVRSAISRKANWGLDCHYVTTGSFVWLPKEFCINPRYLGHMVNPTSFITNIISSHTQF